MAAPTFHQIRAQVAAIRQKIPHARVIGIRSAGRWAGEHRKQDGGECYVIEQCDSPLAMRIALRNVVDEKTTKVLITSLEEKDLSADILVRLAKRQLFPIDSWQIVKSLFQAHAVDPRITRHRWIAERLLEFIPADGYPPASGGFLDAETVWPILLGQGIGLATERPDLLAVLRWSMEAENVQRFRLAPEEFREAATAWLSGMVGPTVEAVLRCVAANERPDALPIGLAAAVVFHSKASGRLDKAAGKMEERFLDGLAPEEATIARWVAAATEVVRLQLTDQKLKRQQLQRADEILREVGAESFAFLSNTSPLGFDQRLADFGKHLVEAVGGGRIGSLEVLAEARRSLGQHELAARERRRLERVDMALRLARWLAATRDNGAARPKSFAEAVEHQLAEGGFVDWARLSLRAGDPVRELSEAYAKLFERVAATREDQARHFAELLRDWTAAGSTGDAIIPVERVLETVVAPLAQQMPVLLIIADGMSAAVCRELLTDITRHDWVALCEEGRALALRGGIATVPSVTEVSRTSLLCGRLRAGNSSDERGGFAEHPALLAQSRTGSPPILFHKASLQEEGDAVLAGEVRKEIASSHRRIVGVVVNAVDDYLLKGEQIDTRWTRDAISVLPALLYEAQLSRRLVIIVSDHGHVLDSIVMKGRLCEGGERWRIAEGEPEAGEIRLSGPRVMLPESKELIAPWTERIRYGVKKNGYHGGVTPQEMVSPIIVLSATDSYPQGWVEAPVDMPSWWEETLQLVPEMREVPAVVEAKPKLPKKPKQLDYLFDVEGEEEDRGPAVDAEPPVQKTPGWISTLLDSPIFVEQKSSAGRAVPSDEVFVQLLEALDHRGGKMTSAALARVLNYPAMRLRGLLAVIQRVINIDGYAVLTRDAASDTVELNRELLRRQFDLD